MLPFDQARARVVQEATRLFSATNTEVCDLPAALHRVLAQPVLADRDYPPFDRATRDGYAVRSAEARSGAVLHCVGEIKAGDFVENVLQPATCVHIMTGAAVPPEADAVVMVEFTTRSNDAVTFQRETSKGQNIVPRGSEARTGDTALSVGTRLGYAELAIAAQVGAAELTCYRKPRVAILTTGDEVVAFTEAPGPFQIRNSNEASLIAQVQLAGATPVPLGNAADRADELSSKIELGLQEDILILSGGVSMGKYDLVESVLTSMGAEFFFDGVAIRPGKPTVFGRCRKTLVFGLPGNPVSTMVTFQLFATAAIDVLSGAAPRPLPFFRAILGEAIHENASLAHFLPARIEWTGSAPEVKPLRWQGSGDVAALSRCNCFVYVPADHRDIAAGELVAVLPRVDAL